MLEIILALHSLLAALETASANKSLVAFIVRLIAFCLQICLHKQDFAFGFCFLAFVAKSMLLVITFLMLVEHLAFGQLARF